MIGRFVYSVPNVDCYICFLSFFRDSTYSYRTVVVRTRREALSPARRHIQLPADGPFPDARNRLLNRFIADAPRNVTHRQALLMTRTVNDIRVMLNPEHGHL